MIYLPSGSDWYDFWTNEIFKGGNEISKETSIDIIPLYIKSGSILQVGPEVQYATEKTGIILNLGYMKEQMVHLLYMRMKMTIITMKKEFIQQLPFHGMIQKERLL